MHCNLHIRKDHALGAYAFYNHNYYYKAVTLRLVFNSDGVVVGVVIRSLERYDLVKIKLTESEAEH